MTTLMNERIAIGGFERLFSFEELVEHALANRERLSPVVRDELARLYTWVRTLELLNARVVTKLGRGEMPMAESSVMKLSIARIVSKVGDLGIDSADGLLLLIEIEDALGLEISDDAAEKMNTVADILDFVAASAEQQRS